MASEPPDDGFSFLDPLIDKVGSTLSANTTGWRVRLKFNCANEIQSENAALDFRIGMYGVTISSATGEAKLDSKRLVLNVRGINAESDAHSFAGQLVDSVHVAAAIRKMGVDLGEDKASTVMFNGAKKAVHDRSGITIRDDVHGTDVFFDDGFVRHFSMNASVSVSMKAETVLNEFSEVFRWVSNLPSGVIEFAKLLNRADITLDPAAKLAVSFSAIESYTEPLNWSDEAKKFIGELVVIAAQNSNFLESKEIHSRLESMRDFGPSSNKRVRGLLDRLGLSSHAKLLTKHYKVRSKLVHGVYVPMSIIQEAANEVRAIAGYIFEEAIKPFQTGANPPRLD